MENSQKIPYALCIKADVIDSRRNHKERILPEIARELNESYAGTLFTPFSVRAGDELFSVLLNRWLCICYLRSKLTENYANARASAPSKHRTGVASYAVFSFANKPGEWFSGVQNALRFVHSTRYSLLRWYGCG